MDVRDGFVDPLPGRWCVGRGEKRLGDAGSW
jgi:hypothetical protein